MFALFWWWKLWHECIKTFDLWPLFLGCLRTWRSPPRRITIFFLTSKEPQMVCSRDVKNYSACRCFFIRLSHTALVPRVMHAVWVIIFLRCVNQCHLHSRLQSALRSSPMKLILLTFEEFAILVIPSLTRSIRVRSSTLLVRVFFALKCWRLMVMTHFFQYSNW